MRLLCVTRADDPSIVLSHTTDDAQIAASLRALGVTFRRMPVVELPATASDDEVLSAHRAEVDEYCGEGKKAKAEVVRMHPDPADPEWPEMAAKERATYFNEHTHTEDEVWYFTYGGTGFYIHVDEKVHVLVSEPGDLLSIPAGTRHWFDSGWVPDFCAFRFYLTSAGFDGEFTGDPIADGFAGMEEWATQYAGTPR